MSLYQTFSDPALTEYEVTKQELITSRDMKMPESSRRILELVETYRDAPHTERWIEAMEGLPQLAVPGLVYLVNKTEHKGMESNGKSLERN